ncbi:hypothetical protein EG68_06999 [Paragonimus skrjabini miyazakii]|uniref:Uncharacterized protein n=1 Tax=Paragonimus skrjabini miyazakii TaxID=59628 RepID=A0A8S9YMH5_9TREM|nr:hypothetical protein EG68_06999 [Paragonimus skrjabini miyazakii]
MAFNDKLVTLRYLSAFAILLVWQLRLTSSASIAEFYPGGIPANQIDAILEYCRLLVMSEQSERLRRSGDRQTMFPGADRLRLKSCIIQLLDPETRIDGPILGNGMSG